MDDFGLDSFLSDIQSRDNYLKEAPTKPMKENLPPVRGAPDVEDITPVAPPPSKKKDAKPPPAPKPKDAGAIWDTDEVPAAAPGARPASAPTTTASSAAAAAKGGMRKMAIEEDDDDEEDVPVKPRQRKHAYEYFNQWDAYDVDGELNKLEDPKPQSEVAAEPAKPKNDGLPPDMTAAMLAQMSPIEIERRAMNEKEKGNEAYKAGEYKTATVHYTHSLRLQPNNHVVYGNRGMCYLKLKQYRQALADSTAAIQIDDSYTKAYLRRGISHRRLSQHAQALKDLDIVLHREPHNKEAAEHRRCSKIEREKELKAEREREETRARPTGGKKSSVVIEEIDGDSDDDSGAPVETPEMRRMREAEEAKDAAERARAAAAEKAGRERKGPFVDPQAQQESDDLLKNLTAMSGTNLSQAMGNSSKPKPETKKKVAIVEEDDEEDAAPAPVKKPVARDGFEPCAKFAGARPGWVFKTGTDGLGYYREGPAPKQTGQMRRMAIEEDDDDEEDVPVKPAAAKGGMRKMAIEEDDDDEEDVPVKPAAAKGGMRKMAIEEDDDDEEDVPVKPAAAKGGAAPTEAAAEEPPSRVMAEYKAAEAKERGTAALRKGDYRGAAEAYHEACKLQPSVHTHFSNLSLALLKFGQPQHAATAARRCTELEPAFGKGFFRLGQALKANGEYDGACEALKEALKLHQKAHPNGGKEAGKESAEIVRELSACREMAKEAGQAAPVGKVKGITPIETAPSTADAPAKKGASSGASSPPKRSVDHAQAVEMGKRAAALAPKTAAMGGAATTFSAFERQLNTVWAKGKGASSPDALRDVLAQLPTSAGEMSAFVRESLTEELLSGVIHATKAAGESGQVAAARLAHLAECKRFDMAWMFAGKAEKAAVQELLEAGQGELSAAELKAAAQRYGVKLA